MKRFGVIVLIVVILAAGLVGYNKYVKDDTPKKTETISQTNKQNDPTEGGRYLVIKEWGVRFKVPEGLKNPSYTYNSEFDYPSIKVPKIEALSGCDTKNIFAISRGKAGDRLVDQQIESSQDTAKAGDYYYFIAPPQSSCFSEENSEGEKEVYQVRQQLIEMVKSITVMN